MTPLHYAVDGGNTEMILMLVNAGADIKSEQGNQRLAQAMMKFVEEKDGESLEILLSHEPLREVINVSVYIPGSGYDNRITMLELAARQDDIKTLKILNKHGVDANTLYEDGKTSLHELAEDYCVQKSIYKDDEELKSTMMIVVLLFNADLTLKDGDSL